MKTGDRLRFKGPAGALFVVIVGDIFTAEQIRSYTDSGQWTQVPAPRRRKAT